MLYIQTFRGKGKQPWRYRLKSRNGRIVAQSEGYTRERDRDRAAEKLSADIGESGPLDVRRAR